MLALCVLLPTAAQAWGGLGHRTVAAIAENLLPAAKVARMNALLGMLETDNSFVDAASYPDEYLRDVSHQWDTWHFADLPDDGSTFSCNNTCLFDQLSDNLAILRQGNGDKAEAVALAWVIHLVGDLHQPLHMTGKLRGGNSFAVKYRGSSSCRLYKRPGAGKPGRAKVELHSAWDDCLVNDLANGRSPEQLASDILGSAGVSSYVGSPYVDTTDQTPWLAWGNESHALANSVAFASLRPNADLEDDYINGALSTVQSQLLKAGIRLAYLLDRNFQ
jgi:hypothetical protein